MQVVAGCLVAWLVKATELGACTGLQAAALCTHKHTDAAGGRMAHVWDMGLEARTPEFSPGCALGSLFDDLSSGSRGMVCRALRRCPVRPELALILRSPRKEAPGQPRRMRGPA